MEGHIDRAKSKLYKVTPRKFFCYYSLKTGSNVVGIVMCIIMLIIIIGCLVQVLKLNKCQSENCSENTMRISKGFSITAVVYSILMLLINFWLFYGIHKLKASVIGSYVAISLIWYLQTLAFFLVVIILLSESVSLLSWLLALIFGLIAMAILLYGLLVVLGYWLHLKSSPTAAT